MQTPQQHGARGDEAGREDRLGLGLQELPPGLRGPAGRGADASVLEDLPDRRRGDPAPADSSPAELARLEARAARLARQYRGQLVQLTDAEKAAQAAAATVARLRRELGHAHADLARLAAASYMGGWQDSLVAMVGNGDPQRMLEDTATIAYLARHRAAQQQELARYMAAVQRAPGRPPAPRSRTCAG